MSEIFLKMCSSVTIYWIDTFPHFLFVILDRSDRKFLICILYSVTLIYLLDIVLAFCFPEYCSYRSWPTSDPIHLLILFISISFWIIKVSRNCLFFIWSFTSNYFNCKNGGVLFWHFLLRVESSQCIYVSISLPVLLTS